MKKTAVIIVILIFIFSTLFASSSIKMPEIDSTQIIQQGYNPTDNSSEKTYSDALSSFLSPHVNKAIEEWYYNNPQYTGGSVDPWSIKILSIERIPNKTL